MIALNTDKMHLPGRGNGAPATVANAVGAGVALGALAGIPGGPLGVIGSAFMGGMMTAIGATGGGWSAAGQAAANADANRFFNGGKD